MNVANTLGYRVKSNRSREYAPNAKALTGIGLDRAKAKKAVKMSNLLVVEPELLTLDYCAAAIGRSHVVHADCFEWLGRIPSNSLHAIVTDPPYGVKEYDFDQIEKRANGNGGI